MAAVTSEKYQNKKNFGLLWLKESAAKFQV
jgi:hypothetical protein